MSLVCQISGTTGWSWRFSPTPARSTAHVDAELAQVVGRADAGEHQQLRGVDRTAGEDDLARRRVTRVLAAALPEGHADRPPALDHDPRRRAPRSRR